MTPQWNGRPPAEPWRRAAARIIDVATVATVLWTSVLLHILWFMAPMSDRFPPEPWGRWFVPTMSFVVLYACFDVLFVTRSRGQTPGKDIMKIRVVHCDGREHVGVGRASVRALLPVLAAAGLPLWWVALAVGATMLPVVATGGRGLHDRLAGTVVVRYDRDLEDVTAKRPVTRRERRRRAREAEDRRAVEERASDRAVEEPASEERTVAR